ncbi:MAG TPA: cation transporting ATPase C-terminal domain-containing protein, partial [Methanospirillum sp.]|nr:cation transporting ATPase C-terminal domain-containing protein [Methanospirillum sp.]
ILTNRSWSETIVSTIRTPNTAMRWVFVWTLLSLGLILAIPALSNLFRFELVSAGEFVTCILAAGVSVLWFEAWKLWNLKSIRKDRQRDYQVL